jgi:hypothetical protein
MPVNVKLLLCLAAITIGGCSGASVRLNAEYNRSTYDHLNFSLYHADRDTKVVVHGNPFAMASTTPGKSAERNLRVVMAFNAAEDDTYDLCGGKVDTRTSKGAMRLSAAWCFGDRQDSFVEAEVNGAGGINDPRFRALIQQTVLNLFPTHMDRELFGDDNGDDSPKGG